MKKYRVYTLWAYDVQGNEAEGFFVNDKFEEGTYHIPASVFTDDKKLFRWMKKHAIIRADNIKFKDVYFDGDDKILYVDYKGCPEFELRREE